MFHATIALLLLLSMLANGQQRNVETIPGDANNDSNNEQEGDNIGSPGESDDNENNGTTNATTTPTTTTATISPSASTTSGASAIFPTNSLIFSIALSLKFFRT